MDDSTAPEPPLRRWLMLIHQVPPRPDYLRVKVRRRLQRVGAVPVKSTVYVLPATAEALEDLQWIRGEIEDLGGTALVCEVTFVAGITDEEVAAMLRAEGAESVPLSGAQADRVEPGRTWVTRAGVHVDRMGSAWLIRRFIDAAATFRFVAARGYRPKPGELRFDMYEAEYTHEGERCTFETLVRRFGLQDETLAAIGEIVRDIDCKAEQYSRAETAGIASLIRGIVQLHSADDARLEQGAAVFDQLYAGLRGGTR